MHFGISMFPTDLSMNVVDLARTVEDHGFESIWVPEHTHIPTRRVSPYPGKGELPPEYSRIIDPFVVLGAVAAATTSLRLGTGVCLVVERDPILLAKEVASVDFLSGGRFLFGIGGGWNLEEMANHGTDPKRRFAVMKDRVLAMKAIWTNDAAEYHGEFVNFDPIWQWPKPVQKPHPPIMIGGNGPLTLKRVVEYGDEWFPTPLAGDPSIFDRVEDLQRLAAEAGRGRIPVSVFLAGRPNPTWVERYQRIGVHRIVWLVPPVGAEEGRRRVAEAAEVATSFR
ncbi:MAG TPA: LLM class F420-dependent oxidoreductase [Dehalococcoidia bacterium]|nr:LLM class F420-dependent oxidoreductase [Dehalococcoidia bacterium]